MRTRREIGPPPLLIPPRPKRSENYSPAGMLLLMFVVLAAWAFLFFGPQNTSGTKTGWTPSREVTARSFAVIRVIDGDTFVVEYDGEATSVRLLGYDAPEPREPGGPEATARLRELIDGKMVRLEFAPPRHPGAAYKRDHFGRLLARVYVDDIPVTDALRAATPP